MFQSLKHHYIEPIRSFDRPARLFLVMTIINGVILSGWQLFFNFFMLQSGFTREFLGLVNSLPSAAGLIFGHVRWPHLRPHRAQAFAHLGIGFSSLSMLAQITFRQPAIIVASAFLTGTFNMLFIVSQAPLMMKLSDPKNRTMLFSLNFGLQTLSGAVGNLFAGQTACPLRRPAQCSEHSATAYQAVLVMSILLGTTSLIPAWIMKEPTRQGLAAQDSVGANRLPESVRTPVAESFLPPSSLSSAR